MEGSILDTTKKKLGIAADYTEFDLDIVTEINSVFSTLTQLGVGPADGFEIEDATKKWSDFLGVGLNPRYNFVRTYIYQKVRLSFDPPATSFGIEALKEQIKELEFRLSVVREEIAWVPVVVVLDGGDAGEG